MMISDKDLSRAFQEWRAASRNGPSRLATPHLKEEVLAHLAGDGGLAEATREELEHLDACPECLAAWAAWRRAHSVATGRNEEQKEQEPGEETAFDCAFGLQEAAASQGVPAPEPLVFTSSCGAWRLEWLPQRDQPENGLLILTALNPSRAGIAVTAYDRQGRVLLTGSLEERRLARRCRDFSSFDLSLWTVISKN